MQLVDQAGPLGDQVVAPLIEQRQDSGQVLTGDRVRVPGQRGDAGRRGGVDDVVLAAAAARELAHPRCRSRGDVQNHLAAGDQPLRQVPAQAASVLHRPAT